MSDPDATMRDVHDVDHDETESPALRQFRRRVDEDLTHLDAECAARPWHELDHPDHDHDRTPTRARTRRT